MTPLKQPLTRALTAPAITGKLRRPLVVTLHPDGRLTLRPKRAKAQAAVVELHVLELYIRALINGRHA
jgi:hypothetical protein